ncbi:MAG: hypothetical protein O2983_11055 [Planctomycetota bacterium]|nr:hypothetical protein [Planctomycetota bacterium]MDA0920891.1 hypothetical protein [Planctomycetota bacterium]MDA1160139.1 hypothetical protein [Planctomycetota bacterium]
MSRHGQPAIAVFVALLAVFSTIAFMEVMPRPSASLADSTDVKMNRDVVDIELADLATSLGYSEPYLHEKLPQIVRSLENKRIRIRGYMNATSMTTAEKAATANFIFFGEEKTSNLQDARMLSQSIVHYRTPVSLRGGQTAKFSEGPFIIEGTLRIEPQFRNGHLTRLYHIEDATMKPTKPRDGYQKVYHISWC